MCVCVLTYFFLTCLDMSQRNVCYVLCRLFMHQLSTQSPKGYCPKLIHHHYHPQVPALPSAWEKPHWNVFKRHSSSNKQASSSTGMYWSKIMGGNCEYLHAWAFVSTSRLFWRQQKCVYVFVSICVFQPFLISEQWVHTVRGSNQYQLSSNTKRVKRSIPPQHDNCSSQAWLI